MEAIHSQTFHLAARAVLTIIGAALLWWAPATVSGLLVMLVGLVCAVSGLLAGDFVPEVVDLLADHMQAASARRAS